MYIYDKNMNKFSLNQPLFTYVFIVIFCFFIGACSDSKQRQMQNDLLNEFIETYNYVTKNFSVSEDISSQFEHMKNSNSDALSTIAYRWHMLAQESCQLSNKSINKAQRSSYEKLLGENISNEWLIEVTSEEDRKCLADAYRSNWIQINRMLNFNFPNIK